MEFGQPLHHLALIPDGNRRWAERNKTSLSIAYHRGADTALKNIRHAHELGIHTVTFWGLSTENWKRRTPDELELIMDLMESIVNDCLREAHDLGAKVIHLGNKDELPSRMRDLLGKVESDTALNKRHVLNLAINYGGQDELLRAIRRQFLDQCAIDMKIVIKSLEEPSLDDYLDTAGQPYPNPDLVIRTSGEIRLSGFMPWQTTYSELYFVDILWPDFTPMMLDIAISEFQKRKRRFGGST